jgi:antitoxin ParD1/3/4
MPNFEIFLPELMKEYVDRQVVSGGYSSISSYFEELVKNDQKAKIYSSLETLFAESLDSGVATPMTAQDWGAIRQAVRSTTQGQNPNNA